MSKLTDILNVTVRAPGLPAKPGVNRFQLTQLDTLALALNCPAGGSIASQGLNPATLDLSIYLDASIAAFNVGAGTWTSNASAGISGSQTVNTPSGFVKPGSTTLNTFTIPTFTNGSGKALGATLTAASLFPSGLFTFAALVNLSSIVNNPAANNPQNGDPIIADLSGNYGLMAYSGGPGINGFAYDTALRDCKATGLSNGNWHLAWCVNDGTHIHTSVDSGSETLVSNAAASALTSKPLFGGNNTNSINGAIAFLLIAPVDLSTQKAGIQTYLNGKFGVTV